MLRDALSPYGSTLSPRLWALLDSARPGESRLLPVAGALATYAPDEARWADLGAKVSRALVAVNPVFLGSWLDVLRPVRSKLTSPLATIFADKSRAETEHTLATNILADYASDDPDRLAELLMVADAKAYRRLFLIAEKHAERILWDRSRIWQRFRSFRRQRLRLVPGAALQSVSLSVLVRAKTIASTAAPLRLVPSAALQTVSLSVLSSKTINWRVSVGSAFG